MGNHRSFTAYTINKDCAIFKGVDFQPPLPALVPASHKTVEILPLLVPRIPNTGFARPVYTEDCVVY